MAELIITLSPGADPAQVREALEKAGMRSLNVLGEIGVVTGEVAPADQYKLAAIEGVEAIEENAPVSIGPPIAPPA